MKKYGRQLNYSEATYHFVKIDRKFRKLFPPWYEVFIVVIKKKKIKCKVDNLNRIWASSFWDKLPHFEEGDTILFEKNPDGSFNLSVK